MDDSRKEFLLSEYSALRQEILDTLKEVPSNEKIALVFSGAYWAWVLSNTAYLSVAIWVPGMLTVLFALRAKALDRKFDSFHDYLLKIEKEFELDELGWEKHLGERERGWFTRYNRAFWPALVLGNFAAGAVVLYVS